MKPSFFIFGYGYTASAMAEKLILQGYKVVGTTRAPEKKLISNASLIKLIEFDSLELEHYLSQSTHILISIGPLKAATDLVLLKYADLIKKYASNIQWLGYLSSTGVYGDHQGQWVSEHSTCNPQGLSGILRLKAETAWISFAKASKLPLHLFRLAGIYGPGRNALQRIQAGKKYSLFKEGQVFSRIYVDDIVSVLFASIHNIHPLSIYNVADDEPEASHIVDAYACSLLNRPPLPLRLLEQASLSQMEQEFYSSNRRVSNVKIKNELKVKLNYPSYKEGLKQIINQDA